MIAPLSRIIRRASWGTSSHPLTGLRQIPPLAPIAALVARIGANIADKTRNNFLSSRPSGLIQRSEIISNKPLFLAITARAHYLPLGSDNRVRMFAIAHRSLTRNEMGTDT